MLYYWDSSALLALLFREPNHARLRETAVKALPGYTSFFSLIEMESAYFRRVAEGWLSKESLPALRLQAERLETGLAVLWPEMETLALARSFSFEFGLRPGDSLQLASAQHLAATGQTLSFISLDKKLNEAAQAVGLRACPGAS